MASKKETITETILVCPVSGWRWDECPCVPEEDAEPMTITYEK